MSSSPNDSIGKEYIISEMYLSKKENVAFLLVEGIDDRAVYKNFIDEKYCEIILCYGEKNLCGAITLLNQQRTIKGYIGIKDADFDIIDDISREDNLFLTDGHDLETMICSSDAFDYYNEVHLRGEDTNSVRGFIATLREKIFNIGSVIGYLRWLSHKHKLGIEINAKKFLDHVKKHQDLTLESAIEISKFDKEICDIDELNVLLLNHFSHLCQGHDLTLLMGHLYRGVSKKRFGKEIPGGKIEDGLILAYKLKMFKQTKLFSDIVEWEKLNKPYKILED